MHLLIFYLIVFGSNFLMAKMKREEHYCKVKERAFSHEFNFTELSNESKDYIIELDKNVSLTLQLCEFLRKSCNGIEGVYSICLSKNGKEIGIGKEPPNVVFEFGEVIFKYIGDKCGDKYYTVDIKMKCDYGVKDKSGMKLFAAGYNDCNFNIEWRTKVACTEAKRINCAVDDKSGHYDLSQLTNLSDNYHVYINDNYSVILNVCHSILYGKNTCKSNSGACLVSKFNSSKSIGELVESLKYISEDGSLLLTYEDGFICRNPEGVTHAKTTIKFICDLDAIGTLPQYAGDMEICDFKFIWRTASACSEQALHKKSLQETNVCAVKHPITNQMFNLTALMYEEKSVIPFGINEVYKFRICHSIRNTTCKTGTGACKLHKNISGGIANSQLMWKETGPYLNYTNGDICMNHQQRYTIIEFYCGPDDPDNYEIEEMDLCFDIIKISTKLVCEKQKKSCSTFNNEINFQQLILDNSNYIIKTEDTVYYINICRPLVPENNLHCSDNAAMCKTTNVNGKVININLGSFDQNPILTTDRSAVLIYHNGSICEEDKKRRIESSISFLCDINSAEGKPQFIKYNNCTYYFEWKTSMVCGKIYGTFNENCSVSNALGDFRNLLLLQEDKNLLNYVSEKNNENYEISLCGNLKNCDDAFMCKNNINYGTKVNVLFDYTVDLIQLQYTGGSKCSDDSFTESTFTIICNKAIPLSTPNLLKEESCRVQFEWYTPKICRSSVSNTTTTTDTAIQSIITKNNLVVAKDNSLNGFTIAVIVLIISLLLVIYYFRRNLMCSSSTISSIFSYSRRHSDRVKYSRVNTMEEVSLLLNTSDPSVIESDTDDDLLEA